MECLLTKAIRALDDRSDELPGNPSTHPWHQFWWLTLRDIDRQQRTRSVGFIHNLASLQYLAHEPISQRQALFYLLRRSNQQIDGSKHVQLVQDRDRLPNGPASESHYHEQINVRVGPWSAVSVRSEQYDLVRMKLTRDLFGESLDLVSYAGTHTHQILHTKC